MSLVFEVFADLDLNIYFMIKYGSGKTSKSRVRLYLRGGLFVVGLVFLYLALVFHVFPALLPCRGAAGFFCLVCISTCATRWIVIPER